MTTQRINLDPRRPVAHTLTIMRDLVRRQKDNRKIRHTALTVTEGMRPGDDLGRMQRILSWVRSVMRFERDVRGIETLHDPTDTLERIIVYGEAPGDCDDGSILLATLLESIGIPTRFVALSIRPDRRLHHVAVEARDPRSPRWYHLDPFWNRTPASGDRPPVTRALTVNV